MSTPCIRQSSRITSYIVGRNSGFSLSMEAGKDISQLDYRECETQRYLLIS